MTYYKEDSVDDLVDNLQVDMDSPHSVQVSELSFPLFEDVFYYATLPDEIKMNKPGPAQVGAISKAQK